MNQKNSTSNPQLEVSVYGVSAAYWKGFARRISIPIAALIVVHISARVLSGLQAVRFGYDFGYGFGLTDYAYVYAGGAFMHLFMLHIMTAGIIIVLVFVPLGLYHGLKWLIKG